MDRKEENNMISEKEKREIQELKEIISELGQKERAMASGYISALRDIDMLKKDRKAAG